MRSELKKLKRLIALTMIFLALASFSAGFVVGYYVHESIKTSKHTKQIECIEPPWTKISVPPAVLYEEKK